MTRADRAAPLRGLAAAVAAGCLLALGSASPADAQEQGSTQADTTEAAAGADTAPDGGFVYRREVFEYPGQGRRNPFRPLDAGQQEGPQFQNLRLSGVIYSPSIGSVAVLVDRTTGKRYRVRDGQRIGDARVLEIRQSEVRFSVSGAGTTRAETLQVEQQERESQG